MKTRRFLSLALSMVLGFAVLGIVRTAVIGIASYQRAVQRAKEAVLAEDLHAIHMAVTAFTEDEKRPPRGLDELVQTGYLKTVPINPMDNRRFQTW